MRVGQRVRYIPKGEEDSESVPLPTGSLGTVTDPGDGVLLCIVVFDDWCRPVEAYIPWLEPVEPDEENCASTSECSSDNSSDPR